jgi:hypothetical protein
MRHQFPEDDQPREQCGDYEKMSKVSGLHNHDSLRQQNWKYTPQGNIKGSEGWGRASCFEEEPGLNIIEHFTEIMFRYFDFNCV